VSLKYTKYKNTGKQSYLDSIFPWLGKNVEKNITKFVPKNRVIIGPENGSV